MTEEELKAILQFKQIDLEDCSCEKCLYQEIEECRGCPTMIKETLLNLIEKLRIKNGKEFVRGVETNEKLWQAKIKAMEAEYFEKVKHYDCDTADWKQSQDMGSYVVLDRLLKGEQHEK